MGRFIWELFKIALGDGTVFDEKLANIVDLFDALHLIFLMFAIDSGRVMRECDYLSDPQSKISGGKQFVFQKQPIHIPNSLVQHLPSKNTSQPTNPISHHLQTASQQQRAPPP